MVAGDTAKDYSPTLVRHLKILTIILVGLYGQPKLLSRATIFFDVKIVVSVLIVAFVLLLCHYTTFG